MLPTRKPTEEASSSYSNKTLVHNWWEDRYVPGETKLNTTERVFARDLGEAPPPPPELATTKRDTDHRTQTSPAPVVIKKPSMYTNANVEARIATYGDPEKLAYTLGRVGPDGSSQGPDRSFETTNSHFYVQKPLDATTSRPGYYTGTGKQHAKTGRLEKDIYDTTTHKETEPLGAKGTRGEMTRNPKESGNPYGVSVYVDEYAKWQTKLAGMPLEESVKKAQTKYF